MQRIKYFFLYLDYMLVAAIVFCQVLGYFRFTSLFFYGTFFASFLVWLCTLVEKVDALDLMAILIIFIAFINVVLNGILEGASFSFDYFKKYLMFSCTIFFFAAAIKIQMGKHLFAFLESLYACVSVFLIFMYIRQNTQMHFLNGYYTKYLTFRFTNPNLTGLFLACIIMFLVAVCFREERVFWKCVLLGLAAADTFFLYQTLSRNALLTTVIYLCLSLALTVKKEKFAFKNWFLWLISVASLVFAFIYMQIVQSPSLTKVLSFIVSEGKGLDSRWIIWNRAIRAFASSPILGAYCQVSDGTGVFQLHNTHIDILASYGIIVLLLVCVFLFELMRTMQARMRSYKQSIFLVGFICVIFLGLGEAALFSGGLGIYILAGVFLLIPNTKAEELPQLSPKEGGMG